jgi:hypothetical protein
MPALKKPSECTHEVKVKKAFQLTPLEKKSAKAKKIPVPDYVYMFFCLECWSINPKEVGPIEVTE